MSKYATPWDCSLSWYIKGWSRFHLYQLRVASFNIPGGLKGAKENLINKSIAEHEIHISFMSDTNYDCVVLKKPYGCLASSTVVQDERGAPLYGTAVYIRSQALASESCLFHVDQSQLSVCFQGYVFGGLYKVHREHMLRFNL